MKVLVIGGAGYIGSHAVYMLIENNYDVVIIDDLSTGFQSNIHPNAEFYNGNILDELFIRDVFESESDIEAVMNFAGSTNYNESIENPIEYFENNFDSVKTILKVAQDFNVKTIIFSSSSAVYGEPKLNPIDELDEKTPISPLGESKLAAEAIIRWWSNLEDVNFVIFRYFNVAGTHDNKMLGIKNIPDMKQLIPSLVLSTINNDKIFKIFGNDYKTKDGTCIRDFIHVNDLIRAHILGLNWSIENQMSGVFNLGSGIGKSVMDVYNNACSVLNKTIPFEIVQKEDGKAPEIYANIILAKEILKWSPKMTLDKIILSEYYFRVNYIDSLKKTIH